MDEIDALDGLLAAALPAGSLFAVGGRVRDELRAAARHAKAVVKDRDYLVVGVTLEALEAALAPLGSVDRVGASFAILKFTRDGVTVDIALPRREQSTGSGHRDFEVQSGPEVSLEDDLARRDFRMNMLARAIPGGEIVDPFDGQANIVARQIDIVREETFIEDPLRMLRACQFAARFDFVPTARTVAGMRAAAPLVATVSPQRICEELSKLLQYSHRPSTGIELMRETGILAHIWPELLEGVGIEQNEWHAYDVYRHNLETLDAVEENDLILRLAGLLHDVGKPRVKDGPHFYRHEFIGAEMVREMLSRTNFSHEVTGRVTELVRHHMYCNDTELTDAAVRRFIRRVGTDALDRLFALRAADIIGSGLPKRGPENAVFQARVAHELLSTAPFSVRDLALNGHDVIQAFRAAGIVLEPRGDRRIGAALQALLEYVTDHPECNTADALQVRLAEHLHALVTE